MQGISYCALDLGTLTLNHATHLFVRGSIGDRTLVCDLLSEHHADAALNFAAESHE